MDEVQKLLALLETLEVVEEGKPLRVLETLRQTPRSGKQARIQKYNLDLPLRSVYDHMLSLPIQGEFFSEVTPIALDKKALVSFFLFHDLSEALIGDVPSFTSQEFAKLTYMPHEEKVEKEKKANQLLLDNFPLELKESFCHYLKEEEQKNSPLYRFFYMVDKTDPIIAIWRYIALFRNRFPIDKYLEAMNDFFRNPIPLQACIDLKTASVIQLLQSKENARRYYHGDNSVFQETLPQDTALSLQKLIETPLSF